MDFFEKQARAQGKTRWLIVYFVLAVLGIIGALHVVFTLLLGLPLDDLEVLGWVTGGVAATVLIGSAVKMAELSQGGRVVAAMLGGEPIAANTQDLNERKLLNIIEEMSLASGVPVPEVYLLPDASINAFAAGHGPGDAAIGVTRGCIEQLSRDELQGVIAHEFSHLLHGDMKLNIQLIGLLNGILCIALIGAFLFRISIYAPRSRSSDDRKGGLTVALLAGGAALYLIGWIGVFFGNLIKAAVSRQREFLADASAVQFTRNPQGITGALAKIGKFASRLSSPRASEASHLFFGNGVAESWFSLFATHPPLEERIRAIDPNFNPEDVRVVQPPPLPPESAQPQDNLLRPQSLGRAAALLAALPGFAGESVRDLHGACAFVYALLLDERDNIRAEQLRDLKVDDAMRAEMFRLYSRRAEIPLEQRLPLVDLVIPTLRHLSPDQYAVFRDNVRHLVETDREIHLFEYALQKTILRHLELFFTKSRGPGVKYRSVVPLLPEVSALLTGLAVVGHDDPAERPGAFAAGVRELLVNTNSHPVQCGTACDLAAIDAALDRLAEASPEVKRSVLKACRTTVAHDGVVELREYELLRAIADALDCPMPPMSTAAP
jgi:Zn-dependent protease with chaperone function